MRSEFLKIPPFIQFSLLRVIFIMKIAFKLKQLNESFHDEKPARFKETAESSCETLRRFYRFREKHYNLRNLISFPFIA